MKASSAASPPLAIRPSSHANATKQAMTSEIVTSGVPLVGFASRRGITRTSGQGFLVGFGVVLAGLELGFADAPGLAWGVSGTATRIAWLTLSRVIQTSVAGWPSPPGMT